MLVNIKHSPYDIIVGLGDIRKHALTDQFPTYFSDGSEEEVTAPAVYALSDGGPALAAVKVGSGPKLSPTQTTHTSSDSHSAVQVYPKELFLETLNETDHMDVLTTDDPWSQYLNEAIEKRDPIPAAKQTDSAEKQTRTDANQARGEKGSLTDTPTTAQPAAELTRRKMGYQHRRF